MNNRKHNSTNPFQGDAKRVLCVCSAGLLRSPTAANVLFQEYGYNTRAAGIEEAFALIPVDDVLIHWADEIVCMDKSHKRGVILKEASLNQEFRPSVNKKIIVLDIPDNYSYMDEELKAIILSAYKEKKNETDS